MAKRDRVNMPSKAWELFKYGGWAFLLDGFKKGKGYPWRVAEKKSRRHQGLRVIGVWNIVINEQSVWFWVSSTSEGKYKTSSGVWSRVRPLEKLRYPGCFLAYTPKKCCLKELFSYNPWTTKYLFWVGDFTKEETQADTWKHSPRNISGGKYGFSLSFATSLVLMEAYYTLW